MPLTPALSPSDGERENFFGVLLPRAETRTTRTLVHFANSSRTRCALGYFLFTLSGFRFEEDPPTCGYGVAGAARGEIKIIFGWTGYPGRETRTTRTLVRFANGSRTRFALALILVTLDVDCRMRDPSIANAKCRKQNAEWRAGGGAAWRRGRVLVGELS